jgi:hypothetical protein
MAIEDRLREALAREAERVEAAPMLHRLDAGRESSRSVVRFASLATAAAVLLAVAVAAVLVLRWDRPTVVDPVDRPPKVFHLAAAESLRAGTGDLLVVLPTKDGEGARATVWSATTGRTVELPESRGLPWGAAWSQQLSRDGTHLVRQRWYDNVLEVVDLRAGTVDDLGGITGYCPALSPDSTTVAFVRPSGRDAVLHDLASGLERVVGTTAHSVVTDESDCTDDTFAWAPGGDRIALLSVHDTTVLATNGRAERTIRQAHVTNGSMSWSPDGRRLLLYRRLPGTFVAMTLEDGSVERLVAPPDAVRPVGWSGGRVVWLVGPVGQQRLVLAAPDGADREPWMRLEVGGSPVRTVSWSTRLAGTSR